MSVAQKIEAYLGGIQILRQAVAGMTREQLTARPVPGKWTTLEVVCHLADSDQCYAHRMKRVIAEERPLLIGYDESRFTASLAYHTMELEEELALVELTRRQTARLLRALPEEAFRRVGVHSESGLLTLEKLLDIEVEHIPHHVRFVHEKRRALGLGD